jgi:hypothetical protein
VPTIGRTLSTGVGSPPRPTRLPGWAAKTTQTAARTTLIVRVIIQSPIFGYTGNEKEKETPANKPTTIPERSQIF